MDGRLRRWLWLWMRRWLRVALLLWSLALPAAAARSVEQARYDTAYACEGKTLKIECKEGELIHLIRANYGRFSITICNDHGNTDWSVNCMSHKSLRVLHNRCDSMSKCSVLVSSEAFEDPCPGTQKYVEVHYTCVLAATTTTTSRPSPPWLITSQPSVWSTAKSLTLRPPHKAPSTPEGGGAGPDAPTGALAECPTPAPVTLSRPSVRVCECGIARSATRRWGGVERRGVWDSVK